MVIHIDVHHVFKYPIEFVAQTHFSKYPSKHENFVQYVDTVEERVDLATGVEYKRRIATCTNVLPRLLQLVLSLQEKRVLLQEEAWFSRRARTLHLKSHNITWAAYAAMAEQSAFQPHPDNSSWTELKQHGSIDIRGFGRFTAVLEVFAEKFLQLGVKRGLNIMEGILEERWRQRAGTVTETPSPLPDPPPGNPTSQ